ncbi:unnamed protein product [Sphagnum jensenii]|uniref:Uncharacterized protein n=1 Tax=Sphagnum jensenii TaxID=128206 RepID=A0ABP1BXY3_9BRYO
MGLCASRQLQEEDLEEFEEGEEQEEGGCNSLQMVSEVSSARVSSSGGSALSSRHSTNSLIKALSFDSSRSSAEVGDMGRLGALLCKRRPYAGNPDILSTHLTNILASILRKSSPQQEYVSSCSKSSSSPAAVDISFASYLNTPFIRSSVQGAGFEPAAARGRMQVEDDDRLHAIEKSYAESAAKAAARDTFLFLEKNDYSLRSFKTSSTSGKNFPDELHALRSYGLDSCVPEEDEITLEEEEEEAEEEEEQEKDENEDEADAAAAAAPPPPPHPGALDLSFKAGMQQYGQKVIAEELAAAQGSEQKSTLFESCFPAATTGRRSWASVVNAAKQSASCLQATRPLQISAAPATVLHQSSKRVQGPGDVQQLEEMKKDSERSSSSLRLETVPATSDHKAQHLDERVLLSASPILGCVTGCCSSSRRQELRNSSPEKITGVVAAAAPEDMNIFEVRSTGKDSQVPRKLICKLDSSSSARITNLEELERDSAAVAESSAEAQQVESSGPNSEIIGVKKKKKLQDPNSKLGQNLGADLSPDHTYSSRNAAAGAASQSSIKLQEDLKNQAAGCLPICPMSCLRSSTRTPAAGKELHNSIPCSSCTSSTSSTGSSSVYSRGNLTQHQPQQQQHQLEEPPAADHPAHLPDPFFSFPSSPASSSKLFEEVKPSSGHVMSPVVEEFQAGVGLKGPRLLRQDSAHENSHMRLQAADDDAFGSSLIQSNPAITQDSRAPHHPMGFDKKLKLLSLRQAHGNAAATNPQRSVVGLESLAASTTEETSRLSCTPTAGHNTNGDDDSSCESLEITQGIRIMGFTGTLRNLIHGGKAVQKATASTRAKSVNSPKQKFSSSPTIKRYPSISISRSIDVETKTR